MPTADDIDKQVTAAVALRASGATPGQVVKGLMDTFGLTKRSAGRRWAEAKERNLAEGKAERAEIRAESYQVYMLAERRSFKDGDLRGAVSARKAIVELFGAAEPQKIEHSTDGVLRDALLDRHVVQVDDSTDISIPED